MGKVHLYSTVHSFVQFLSGYYYLDNLDLENRDFSGTTRFPAIWLRKVHRIGIWAVTCDFQSCGILTNVDSYEPLHPPVMLRNAKGCSVSSLTLLEDSSD